MPRRLDGESCPTDRAFGVAVSMTVPGDPRPDGDIGETLQTPAPARAGDMLEVAQLSSGFEYRIQLAQNRIGIIDRAQHQRTDNRVERLGGGHAFDGGFDHRDRHRGAGRGLTGYRRQERFRFQRYHLGDGVRVMGEIGAGAGADLEHSAGKARQVLAAQLAQQRRLMRGHHSPHPREERVVQCLAGV